MRIRTSFPLRDGPRRRPAFRSGTERSCTHACGDPSLRNRVPAILEYLPYRLTDWTAPRDGQRHPWYAGHGYASVRVDVRGHGNSEGLPGDAYSAAELADGVEVVDWLAAQPWCDGRAGMFGISWGGFDSLRIAALAPEPLKAVVAVCCTDDRYDNDVHYRGGSVLAADMHAWAATMLAYASRPPHPLHVGYAWREMWRARLDAVEPFVHTWLGHRTRDDYRRHGSVREDHDAIGAAVLAVGGWHDPYRDTVLRLVEHLPADRVRGIVGPWSHQYPDHGLWIRPQPGSQAGFALESAGSFLELPVRAREAASHIAFEEPEQSAPLGVTRGVAADGWSPATRDEPRPERLVVRDVAKGEWRLEVDPRYGGTRVHPDGLEITEDALETYTIDEQDPLWARTRSDWTIRPHRPELAWDATVRTRPEITCDGTDFHTSDEVVCTAGDEVVFHRTWEKRIPRTAG